MVAMTWQSEKRSDLNMAIKNWIGFCSIVFLLIACEPAREPVEKLSYEQLQKISDSCFANGKIATGNYCKEVESVFETQRSVRKEKARLAKLFAEHH